MFETPFIALERHGDCMSPRGGESLSGSDATADSVAG
jgi:hypothetical protein